MVDEGLDYSTLFNKDLPSPAGRFQGHPKYNFVGGHHDPELQPMDGFIESAANVFRSDPRNISMYGFEGPQGILPLSWRISWPSTGASTLPRKKCSSPPAPARPSN